MQLLRCRMVCSPLTRAAGCSAACPPAHHQHGGAAVRPGLQVPSRNSTPFRLQQDRCVFAACSCRAALPAPLLTLQAAAATIMPAPAAGRATGAIIAGSCWTGGLATLVEKKSRRMELAIYCLSRAIESFALCLASWGWVKSNRCVAAPGAYTCFACLQAAVCTQGDKQHCSHVSHSGPIAAVGTIQPASCCPCKLLCPL